MLDEMSAAHLVEWELMFEQWNIGDYPGYRADVIGATIATVLANIHRGRGQKAYQVGDFLPVFQQASDDPEGDLWQALLESSVPKRKGQPPKQPKEPRTKRATLKPHNPPRTE
jgi:hypothetical protein